MTSERTRALSRPRERGLLSRLGGLGRENLPFQRMFQDFIGEFPDLLGDIEAGAFIPRTNVSETEDAIKLSVELPGMSEDDIDVSMTSEGLLIQGEKREDYEDEGKGLKYVESSYGRFERLIPLTQDIEEDKITANFDRGVLRIELPKTEKAKSRGRKIQISKGSHETKSKEGNQKSRLENGRGRKAGGKSNSEGAQSASN